MADSNWPYIAAAYGITWLVILVYTIGLRGALRRAREDHDRAIAQKQAAE